ncbi:MULTISPECIES: small membrane protein YkgR [Enterobacteriaceae]|nr:MULTISPECIES: small membrane protein YkgR [Enterobacteriaceae]MDL3152719.1 small membrane protein YkgR [Salmonella enterica]MDQ9168662.1 small membrane protein YkgR [Citrobacter freundii]
MNSEKLESVGKKLITGVIAVAVVEYAYLLIRFF